MRLVEIKIIVTSTNHLMNSFRKKNLSHAIISNFKNNGLINPLIHFMYKTRIRLYVWLN
jgi:hypothetical protein